MLKKIYSFVLALSLLSSLFTINEVYAEVFDGGDGSRDYPYLISEAYQLEEFRDIVNSGDNDICVQLIDNIDLENNAWTPIGMSSSGYNGIFDGNGYAIKNMEIKEASSGTSSGSFTIWGSGLFGIIGKNGVVKNVNVDGTFSMNEEQNNDIDLGCICGGNLGTVEECFVTVNFENFELYITSPKNSSMTTIGGIAGVNSGTIRNCYVIGNIDVFADTRHLSVGGIVGDVVVSGTTVENCYAAVDINIDSEAEVKKGGIFGNIRYKGNLKNIYANGDMEDSLINGSDNSSYLTDCSLLSTEYMKSDEFISVLGDAFSADTDNVNDGYPTLKALVYEEESDVSDWVEEEINTSESDKEIFNRLTPPELKNKDLTQDITRAEFCAVAVQLCEEMGGTELNAAKIDSPFTDTSSDPVKKAFVLGITNGISEKIFAPYQLISREQLATMLTRVYKALNLPGWTLEKDSQFVLDFYGITPFEDDEYISDYAKPSVYFMVKNDVIKGTSETTFSPKNVTTYQEAVGYANASREQAIIMAVRMFRNENLKPQK